MLLLSEKGKAFDDVKVIRVTGLVNLFISIYGVLFV